MTKILKYAGIGLLVFVVLFVLVGFLLPGSYHVERSLSIKANKTDIFPLINDLKTWPDWTVWNTTKYPDLKLEYHEPTSGPSASYSWTSKKAGEGTMKIVSSSLEKGIVYDLDFEHGKYPSKGEVRLEPSGDTVKVTWTNEGNLGLNPIGRYFGLLIDGQLGPDLLKNLENLKAKTEKK